ncbi:MAG: putative toxin-antitoxin system toxin component, PIN family [Anaerolineales bacterium]|nr:putative toxin-antitoxin system toxin component, PIN family [Anaerolineales bacterium]
MRVVLDANVIISALISRNGNPGKIFDLWEKDVFDIAVSPAILKEIERVIHYPRIQKKYQLPEEQVSKFLQLISDQAIVVNPSKTVNIIEKDPTDDRYIECAMESQASFIVTGDKHLLELKEYQGIVILPPAGFLALIDIEWKNKKR